MSAMNASIIPANKEVGFTFTRWTTQERFEIVKEVNKFIFEVKVTDVMGKERVESIRRSAITKMFRHGEALTV